MVRRAGFVMAAATSESHAVDALRDAAEPASIPYRPGECCRAAGVAKGRERAPAGPHIQSAHKKARGNDRCRGPRCRRYPRPCLAGATEPPQRAISLAAKAALIARDARELAEQIR